MFLFRTVETDYCRELPGPEFPDHPRRQQEYREPPVDRPQFVHAHPDQEDDEGLLALGVDAPLDRRSTPGTDGRSLTMAPATPAIDIN
jgi:hypothetical protein